MKQCSKCKDDKPILSFYKDSRAKDGLYSCCKICHVEGQTYKNMNIWSRTNPTPSKVATCKMAAIKGRLKNMSSYVGIELQMTKTDLLTFLEENWGIYMKYYRKWERSNWQWKLAPSLDRIDTHKHYSLDNIQIISITENLSKPRRRRSKIS